MGLRPARVYRRWKRPYTRTAVRVPRKAYIKGIPGSKLIVFEVGNKTGNFDKTLYVVADENVQIRHNALESGRVAAVNYLKKKTDEKNFFLKVKVYPHHVLREHAQAAVAQADRFYQGMSHPFGKPKARAARVAKGQEIYLVRVNNDKIDIAKEALRRAIMKLPKGSYSIKIIEGNGN